MLKLLDGDRVEVLDAVIQIAILLEIERGGGRLAFEMRVVHQHGRQIRLHLRQPLWPDLFTKQKHPRLLTGGWKVTRRKALTTTGDHLLVMVAFEARSSSGVAADGQTASGGPHKPM